MELIQASQQGDVWIGTYSPRLPQLKALEGPVFPRCLQEEAGRGVVLLFLQPSLQEILSEGIVDCSYRHDLSYYTFAIKRLQEWCINLVLI